MCVFGGEELCDRHKPLYALRHQREGTVTKYWLYEHVTVQECYRATGGRGDIPCTPALGAVAGQVRRPYLGERVSLRKVPRVHRLSGAKAQLAAEHRCSASVEAGAANGAPHAVAADLCGRLWDGQQRSSP